MSSEVVSIRQPLVLHAAFWGKALSGIKPVADTRVLEVGCGRGESLALLATKKSTPTDSTSAPPPARSSLPRASSHSAA